MAKFFLFLTILRLELLVSDEEDMFWIKTRLYLVGKPVNITVNMRINSVYDVHEEEMVSIIPGLYSSFEFSVNDRCPLLAKACMFTGLASIARNMKARGNSKYECIFHERSLRALQIHLR